MRGDICAICCGEERENSVHCPLDCEYLQEARKREQPPVADPATFPNADIRVTETFLREHEPLLMALSVTLLHALLETPGAVDNDAKDALDALVRTYRTLQSGLYYQTRPENAVAATILDRVQAGITEYQKKIAEGGNITTVRDNEVLGILAFLQRMEIQQNNGRRLGRSFVDFLRVHFPEAQPAETPSSLIV